MEAVIVCVVTPLDFCSGAGHLAVGEPLGAAVQATAWSRSAVFRRLVAQTTKTPAELLGRDLAVTGLRQHSGHLPCYRH
jgi:hypothetical protein